MLICGRYEGVDERIAEHVATDEISIGDFVLSGGELPAALVMESVDPPPAGSSGERGIRLPGFLHHGGRGAVPRAPANSVTACSIFPITQGRQSFRVGRSRKCCFREITKRFAAGAASERSRKHGAGGPIYWPAFPLSEEDASLAGGAPGAGSANRSLFQVRENRNYECARKS